MRIIVPIKQVPDSEELRYDPATRTLVREGVRTVINPYDKRALTEAVRLRNLHGGSITAITMGPPQAREAMIECLGRGVDRCIHLTDRAFAGADTLATARTLAAALRRLTFDLLLLGKYTTDSETGQVGPQLAELLDLPQITGATSIELLDGVLCVVRETDWGFETVECPLPVLLTAAEHLNKPPKTKPPVLEEGHRRLAANPTLIETWTAHDLSLQAEEVGLTGSPTQVADLRPVEIRRERMMLSGDAASSVKSLLRALQVRGLNENVLARKVGGTLPPAPHNPDPQRSVWGVAEWLPSPAGEAPQLRPVALELVSEAARIASLIGGEVVAVLLGSGVEPLAEQLASAGASRVLLADDPALEPYTVEPYAWLLFRAIQEQRPWAVLLPATSFGQDLAPRVAARLGLGLTGDCTGLELDKEGRLLQLKPAFGGQVVAPIISRTLPYMATIRPGMLAMHEPGDTSPKFKGQSSRVKVQDSKRALERSEGFKVTHHASRITERLDPVGLPPSRVRVLSSTYEGEAGLALDDARLVVCVGTGIGGPKALPQVRALAERLGRWMDLSEDEIAIGGTRKVVDLGWLPRQQQVGITGHAVAPDLYLGLGLSGTFNHTVGILRSGTIVAVNTDPQAPIFDSVDIGIVCDWRDFAHVLMDVLTSKAPAPRELESTV